MAVDRHRVIVVGASAAGLRCACRLARLKPRWTITVVEARHLFSYAACGLPYVLSGDLPDAEVLRRTDFGVRRDESYFAAYKGVQVLAGRRATSIDVAGRSLEIEGADGRDELPWDELVLATGARPRRLACQPDHPRVTTFHTWDDVEPLRERLARGEIDHVGVVGAGPVGCELAEALRSLWGADVTLLEATAAPLPGMIDPDLGACVARHLRSQGVRVLTGTPVECITASGDHVAVTARGETVEADAAVVAVGVRPVVDLARGAGVTLGPTGAIAVDDRLATSIPHVWAVGDCVEVRHAVTGRPWFAPLGSLANRQGRTLADVLAGRGETFPAVAGAAAVKVFDWNVAATGCTSAAARESGWTIRSAWVAARDRAHYWPEAQEILLKLVYDPSSQRVLGAQAAGAGEVAKRIDVATQLVVRGATLRDFARLEHAYAPPYSPAIDPLAVAGMAGENQEDGIEAASPDEAFPASAVLDVRRPEEIRGRPATDDGCRAVELAELGARLDEVERSTQLVVCERGTRAAEAVRLLHRRGIRARYLGGGLQWRSGG